MRSPSQQITSESSRLSLISLLTFTLITFGLWTSTAWSQDDESGIGSALDSIEELADLLFLF